MDSNDRDEDMICLLSSLVAIFITGEPKTQIVEDYLETLGKSMETLDDERRENLLNQATKILESDPSYYGVTKRTLH